MNRILVSNWTRRRTELRHGARIAAGGLLSFVLAHALGLPQGYWAVFTAVLVIQGSVGGSWKAATDRLIGTLLGAVYGAVIATLVPHNDVVMLGVALAVSLTPLAFLAAFHPGYRVAPITAVILLLGSAATDDPFQAALLRNIEVSLGGFVGLAVSLLLFPARAHALLGEAANRVLRLLAQLFSELMKALIAAGDPKGVVARNDSIRTAMTALDAITDEAARERRNYLTEDADPEPVTRTLRRVRNDLVLIGRVAAEPLPEGIRARLERPLSELAAAVSEFLLGLGQAFAQRRPPPNARPLDAALAGILSDIEAIKGEASLVALGFAFEHLQRNLGDLTRRAEEFANAGTIPAADESA